MRRELELELHAHGWEFERVTRGTHELWRHTEDGRTVVIPMGMKDVGRKKKNYLAQIKAKPRVDPRLSLVAGDVESKPEQEEEAMEVKNPFQGLGMREFLEQGGLLLGRIRKNLKIPTHILAQSIGSDWTGKRLKDLEATNTLPIGMTPDEFLGWLIGVTKDHCELTPKFEEDLQKVVEGLMGTGVYFPQSQELVEISKDSISAALLKELRSKCGLSQVEAAKLLECGRSTYAHYEAGSRPIPLWFNERVALLELYSASKELVETVNETKMEITEVEKVNEVKEEEVEKEEVNQLIPVVAPNRRAMLCCMAERIIQSQRISDSEAASLVESLKGSYSKLLMAEIDEISLTK